MKTEEKRLTFSVSPAVGRRLEELKRDCYGQESQNRMLRDLLVRGLESSGTGKQSK